MQAQPQARSGGIFSVEVLRPRADAGSAFWDLWDEHLEAIHEADTAEADGLPFPVVAARRARVDALRRAMRPFQEVVRVDKFHNVVTTVGKNLSLNATLDNAAAGVARMGLKGTGTAVVGDTQASHGGWLEQGLANAPTYTGNRPTPSWSAASASSKATSSAVSFSITSTGTVFGAFINIGGSATKDDTTGTLYSAGDFTGGSEAVNNGDTLNVTYTLNAT
jgi:hypothetical protein